ncbi:MAG: hypothetical protein CL607_11055 [Anaerolineaceae bacterium]|nr:hypothetical protein [Anaerolineaceae bacterium]
MASWGPGNFDSDSALDKLAKWCEFLLQEVGDFYSQSGEIDDLSFLRKADGNVIPNADIVVTLCEHYESYYIGVSSDIVKSWKDIYLRIHDRVFDASKYPSDIELSEALQRRRIVEDTFNRLYAIASHDEVVDG